MRSESPAVVDVECQGCGARLVVPLGRRTVSCVYCRSASVLDRPHDPRRPAPRFAVPFVISDATARQMVEGFQARLGPFREPAVAEAPIVAEPVYLPAYLYTALVRARYSAQIGEDYFAGGKRTRKRTEYRTLHGDYATYVREVVVTASRGLENTELGRIEPYELDALHRYTPALIAGWAAEEPTLEHNQSLDLARAEAKGQVRRWLADFMPGDRHTDLSFEPTFERESLDLVLVPVWIVTLSFSETKPPVRLLINGQSGKLDGRAPWSWLRLGIALALALLLVACLAVVLSW